MAAESPTSLRRVLGLVGWGLFLGALIGLWRNPGLLQRLRHGDAPTALAGEDSCDLARAPCTATFSDGLKVDLAAAPTGFAAGQVLRWTAHILNPEARPDTAITGLEITGVSMPMGLSTVALQPTAAGALGQGAQGQAALPLCTASRMLWRADVLLRSGERERVAGFQFWTTNGAAAAEPGAAEPPPIEPGPGRGAAAPDAPAPGFGELQVQTTQGPLRLSDLRGKVVLLYFGYTACPDICPTTLATLAQAVRALPAADQDQVVGLMITLDPARDELSRLQSYTSWFHPAFRGGVAADDAALDAMTADWDVAWRITPLGDSALGYSVDHATDAFLVGPDGSLATRLAHGSPAAEVAASIEAALHPAPTPAPTPG